MAGASLLLLGLLLHLQPALGQEGECGHRSGTGQAPAEPQPGDKGHLRVYLPLGKGKQSPGPARALALAPHRDGWGSGGFRAFAGAGTLRLSTCFAEG